ncbi:MAG: c-type cytochrome [Phenylobacterium sp.]
MRLALFLTLAAFAGATQAQPGPAPPAGDAAKGQALYAQCAACHEIDSDANTLGPTLKGIMGRKAGGLEGYNYSGPMRRAELTWTAQTLDAFLADPQAVAPGTKMPFAGMASAADRADLIAYLQAKSGAAAAPPVP